MRLSRGLLVAALMVAGTAAEAGTAKATEGKPRVIACYKEFKVPAKYSVKKVLIKAPERKYRRRNGIVELLEYPAVYREDRTLIEAEHIIMREIVCK